MTWSNNPWIISNPLLSLSLCTAHKFLLLTAPTYPSSALCPSSTVNCPFITTSATSYSYTGNLDLALVFSVLSIPGMSVVRAHWNSADLEFWIWTIDALVGWLIMVVYSYTWHNTKLRHSTNPHNATSYLTKSLNLLSIFSPPTVDVLGISLTMLLYPYAIPISSTISHSYRISVL